MDGIHSGLMEEKFKSYGSQLAWHEPGFTRSFAELAADVSLLRSQWRTAGLKAGDFIALYCPKPYQTWVSVLAAMGEGGILALLPSRLSRQQIDPYLAQAAFEFWASDEARPSAKLRALSLPQPCELPLAATLPLSIELDKPCLLIYSSGSTGRPKAIQHSARSLISSALATLVFYAAVPGESWLLSLDIAHIGGLQIPLRCLLGGLSCHAGFKPQELSQALHYHRSNFISLVPTQLARALDENREQLKAARTIILGGAACPEDLLHAAGASGLALSISYGSTETASQIAAFPPGELPADRREVGRLLEPWTAALIDGRLALRGAALCQGWWQEGVFHKAMSDFGEEQGSWYATADRASLVDKVLRIEGRDDGIFQVAGENLAPSEILGPLQSLKIRGDFFVIPQPDADYGEVPVLIYRGLEEPPPRTRVLEILAASLPRIKWPRAFYWHKTAEVNKPSRLFYHEWLASPVSMELVWKP